ncbi:DinB family protein [Rubrivirga sp.]|uniref:DinB family protein n=1 Tax=Rubrivirga sp. TaxID=1885344 RepID=UPI003B52D70D
MSPPPSGLSPDARLRHELVALLRGGQAHTGLRALADVPPDRVNDRVAGLPHSLWDLLDHLRFTQADILEYATDPGYRDKTWPADYWPDGDAGPDDWDAARDAFRTDLDALAALAETADLTAELAWAPGYTVLRQVLLAADHNAHHLGQVVALRRQLGLWPPDGG